MLSTHWAGSTESHWQSSSRQVRSWFVAMRHLIDISTESTRLPTSGSGRSTRPNGESWRVERMNFERSTLTNRSQLAIRRQCTHPARLLIANAAGRRLASFPNAPLGIPRKLLPRDARPGITEGTGGLRTNSKARAMGYRRLTLAGSIRTGQQSSGRQKSPQRTPSIKEMRLQMRSVPRSKA